MKTIFIILEIALLLITIPFIAVGIIKKRHVLWIFGLALLFIGNALICWKISDKVLEHRQLNPSQISISERFNQTIDEFNHPYDPCLNQDMDGPIQIHTDNPTMRHIMYQDFVLLSEPDEDYPVIQLTQSASPEKFFSLTKAAYAIRNIIITTTPDANNQWMIQFTGISEVQNEPAADFVIGTGKLDFSCPKYFKIMSRVSVTTSGKIYKYRDNTPEFVETMSNETTQDLTPDKDFGIDLKF